MTLYTERGGAEGYGEREITNDWWGRGGGGTVRGREGEREGRERLVLHLLSFTLSISLTLSPLPPSASLIWWSNWQMYHKKWLWPSPPSHELPPSVSVQWQGEENCKYIIWTQMVSLPLLLAFPHFQLPPSHLNPQPHPPHWPSPFLSLCPSPSRCLLVTTKGRGSCREREVQGQGQEYGQGHGQWASMLKWYTYIVYREGGRGVGGGQHQIKWGINQVLHHI